MKIEVWFKNTALPRKYEALNTFEEGSMFCVQVKDKIYKYPIGDIFRVIQIEEENKDIVDNFIEKARQQNV